jgi:hypothetical protein
MGEQPPLPREASAISGERAGGTHDAVARYDDGNGVGTIGCPDGSAGSRSAHQVSYFPVCNGGPIRNALDFGPNRSLKLATAKIKRQIEDSPFAPKIIVQLPGKVTVLLPGIDNGGVGEKLPSPAV